MTSRQARFITACQTFLVLGVVLAVLAPAANVLSLDVVAQSPLPSPSAGVATTETTPATDREQRSEVAATPADAPVTEYAFGKGAQGSQDGRRERPAQSPAHDAAPVVETPAKSRRAADGRTELTAAPAEVDAFGTVGVTWDAAAHVEEGAIEVQVRTEKDGVWGEWQSLEYHDEHGPDPDSVEGRRAVRPGTEAMVVGQVDRVQARTLTEGAPPADLQLAVVEPGDGGTAVEAPAIDTADLPDGPDSLQITSDTDGGDTTPAEPAEPSASGTPDASGLELQAARRLSAPKPVIYSREQWGADERMRDKSSLRYGTISAGFVHHTVNGNDYTKAQVPGILRSIYAYHTRSRGWSDIGYNFLVDKFGRIWEGRYGGVGKAVVGAHTLGYNDYAFAMSAIGNYDIAEPSQAMLDAYAALFAWKLALAGVRANDTSQRVGRGTFKAINGHRDAGSTACPGRYLYAKLPQIRSAATKIQDGNGPTNPPTNEPTNPPTTPTQPWTGNGINTSLTSRPYADLLVRRSSDGRGMILPTGGLTDFSAPTPTGGKGWSTRRDVAVVPDMTGDRRPDLLYTRKNGVMVIKPSRASGGWGGKLRVVRGMQRFVRPVAVGNVIGDRDGDLVATDRSSGRRFLVWFRPDGTLRTKRLSKVWNGYTRYTAAGDLNRDGRQDVLVRDSAGKMMVRYGQGSGKFAAGVALTGNWSNVQSVVGMGDFTLDGRPDVLVRRTDGSTWVHPGQGGAEFGLPYGPTRTSLAKAGSLSSAGNLGGSAGADLIAWSGDKLSLYRHAGTYELGSAIDTGRDLSQYDVILNAGDWNSDGVGDVIARVQKTQNIVLLTGNGGGKLPTRTKIGTKWTGYRSFAAVGDVTGDKRPDMVATDPAGNVWLYPSNGKGGFAPRSKAPAKAIMRLPVKTSAYDWRVGIESMSGAKSADVVVREKSTGRLYVLDGSAGYKVRRYLGSGMQSYDLVG